MTDADRAHLAAILGMLGSEHAGERAAAGLQAEAFRKKHGMTWQELVSGKLLIVPRVVYVDREVVVETVREVPIERIVYFRFFERLRGLGIDRGVAIVLGGIPLVMIMATYATAIRTALGY